MNIRPASIDDASEIQDLITQLGFSHSLDFIKTKLGNLFNSSNDLIYVYERGKKVIGLITLHFSVQLAFDGDFMSIGYMVVDKDSRGLQIGKQLEEYATNIAKERNCFLIEVYSQAKRTEAHRFYERQGYSVAEKLFNKELKSQTYENRELK